MIGHMPAHMSGASYIVFGGFLVSGCPLDFSRSQDQWPNWRGIDAVTRESCKRPSRDSTAMIGGSNPPGPLFVLPNLGDMCDICRWPL